MASPAAPTAEPEAPAAPLEAQAPATPFAAMDALLPPEMLGPAAHQGRERAARPAPESTASPESAAEPAAEPSQPTGDTPAVEASSESAGEQAQEAAEAQDRPKVYTQADLDREAAMRVEAYAKKRDAEALAKLESQNGERLRQQTEQQRAEYRQLVQRAREGDMQAQAQLSENEYARIVREDAQVEVAPTTMEHARRLFWGSALEAHGEIAALKKPEALERVVSASAKDPKSWATALAAEVAAERDAYWQAEIEKLKAPDGPIAATLRSQLRESMPVPDTAEHAGGAGIVGQYDSESKIRAAIAEGRITTTEGRHYASLIGVNLTRRR